MNSILQFVSNHGYLTVFAAVFARQIGFPVPANLFLVAAGALAAAQKLGLLDALGLAIIACVLADWVWYEAGRRSGDRVLHFLHRFAPDPEAAERKAKERFIKYGPPILLLAKFVPGLDAVAPPLVGTSRTTRLRFLAFETAGAALWSVAYAGLGYAFSRDVNRATAYAATAGNVFAAVAFVGVILAVIKFVRLYRARRSGLVARQTL
jgi:membrane protein DedA with SNARE-associated domain